MSKSDYLLELKKRLAGLPTKEVEERLAFYSEMIDDRVEDGLSEKEAVLEMGPIENIVAQIMADIPLRKIAGERIKPKRRLTAFETFLIVLGFPIWFSLLVSVFAVILSVYITFWSVIISLWAVFASFVASAFGIIVFGFALSFGEALLTGVASIGAGLVLAGLSIFMFYVCKAATKGILALTKKLAVCIKSCFIKRG